jgi:hypothetical protein
MKVKLLIISMLIFCIGYSQPIRLRKAQATSEAMHEYFAEAVKSITPEQRKKGQIYMAEEAVKTNKALYTLQAMDANIADAVSTLTPEQKKKMQDYFIEQEKEEKRKKALEIVIRQENLIKNQIELKKLEANNLRERNINYFLITIILFVSFFIAKKIKKTFTLSKLSQYFTEKVKKPITTFSKYFIQKAMENTYLNKLNNNEVIIISIGIGIISAITIGYYLFPEAITQYGPVTSSSLRGDSIVNYHHSEYKLLSYNYSLGIICFILFAGLSYFFLKKINKKI